MRALEIINMINEAKKPAVFKAKSSSKLPKTSEVKAKKSAVEAVKKDTNALNKTASKQSSKVRYTIDNLIDATKIHRPQLVVGDQRKVSVVKMTPAVNSHALYIKGEAQGTKLYPMLLIAYDLKYTNKMDKSHPLTVSLPFGEYKAVNQIDRKTTPVQIRCHCMDYYFTWQYYNRGVHANAGPKFPKYVRKTTTYPERNPCFIGSTEVKLLDGTVKTMEDLVRDFSDKEFWVYSFDLESGKVVPGKAVAPRITGYESDLIEVTLDSGAVEVCTLDHLWLMRDGTYKQAQNLTPVDELSSIANTNHEVLSVNRIKLKEAIPVYDFDVGTYHNFALNSGAYVHNSHVPGLCKHLVGFVDKLIKDKLIK